MPPKSHSLASLGMLAAVMSAPSVIGERTINKTTKSKVMKALDVAKRNRNKKAKRAKLARKRNRK